MNCADLFTTTRIFQSGGIQQISKALQYYFFALYSETDLELSQAKGPLLKLEKRHTVMVSVELDGNPLTADYWIEKIKKLNAAMA